MSRDVWNTLAYLFGEISVEDFARSEVATNDLEFCRYCPGLAEHCREVIINAFIKLDAVPRTDSIWEGTNLRATIYKVSDYMRREFSEKGTAESAWVLIALGISHWGRFLFPEWWKAIQGSEPIRIDWLVRSAWNSAPYFDSRNISELVNIAMQLQIIQDVLKELKRLEDSVEDDEFLEWSMAIKCKLS